MHASIQGKDVSIIVMPLRFLHLVLPRKQEVNFIVIVA